MDTGRSWSAAAILIPSPAGWMAAGPRGALTRGAKRTNRNLLPASVGGRERMSKGASNLEVASAMNRLLAAGWTLSSPTVERLRLLRPAEVAEILGVSSNRAREIIHALPNSVRLPGDDLRARPADLEEWISAHRLSGRPPVNGHTP